MSTSIDNPYLQHSPPHQHGAGPAGGSGSMAAAAKEPLYGVLPRKVTSGQGAKALVRIFHFILQRRPLIQWSILRIGTRHKPVHETTTFCTIQEDFGGSEEAT